MLEKKLMALTCAAGILVFGACGVSLSAPPVPHLPPAPVPGLALVHTIAIQVEDVSDGDLVDGDALGQAVVANWNSARKKKQVHFDVMQPSRADDATLKIVLIRKSLSCEPSSPFVQKCGIRLITSSNLISRDGKFLWHGWEEESKCEFKVGNLPPRDIWKSDEFMEVAAYCLSFATLPSLFR
jgi:hypothetical protein